MEHQIDKINTCSSIDQSLYSIEEPFLVRRDESPSDWEGKGPLTLTLKFDLLSMRHSDINLENGP